MSRRSRQPGSTPMEKDEIESYTPQNSVMSSVVIVKKRQDCQGIGRRFWRTKQSQESGASEKSGFR